MGAKSNMEYIEINYQEKLEGVTNHYIYAIAVMGSWFELRSNVTRGLCRQMHRGKAEVLRWNLYSLERAC